MVWLGSCNYLADIARNTRISYDSVGRNVASQQSAEFVRNTFLSSTRETCLPWSSFMIMLAAMSIAVGAVLGARFKVLILVPAIIFAILIILIGALVWPLTFASTVITMVVVISSLQVGYLLGVVILQLSRIGFQEMSSRGAISRPTR
jgi:hypothetical protein